jgi:hypothetical protein
MQRKNKDPAHVVHRVLTHTNRCIYLTVKHTIEKYAGREKEFKGTKNENPAYATYRVSSNADIRRLHATEARKAPTVIVWI